MDIEYRVTAARVMEGGLGMELSVAIKRQRGPCDRNILYLNCGVGQTNYTYDKIAQN